MIHTPAEIIRAYLIGESGATFTDPGLNFAWPLYVSEMPDGTGVPDVAGAVYDTPGIIHSRFLASGLVIESFGLQLKTRSLVYTDAFKLCHTTAYALSKVNRVIVNVSGTNYTIDTVRRTSSVLSLGQDEKRRASCSVNFMLMLIGASGL